MCIRDSVPTAVGWKKLLKADRFAVARHTGIGADPVKRIIFDAGKGLGDGFAVRVHACLLYTSDAADERSSVDLGGRRIIKKKKTANNMRTSTGHNKTTII